MKNLNFVKKNWFWLLTIFVSLLALIAAVVLTGEKKSFTLIMKTANPLWFCLAFLFIFLYWSLDSLTLNLLTKTLYPKYKFTESFKTGMIGFLYDALTPFSTGGEPMQVLKMNKSGIKTGDACSIITVKAIIYQLIMTSFGVITALVTWNFFRHKINNFIWFVLFGLTMNIGFICAILFVCIKMEFTKKVIKTFIFLFSKIKKIKDIEKTINNAYTQIDIFHSAVFSLKKEAITIIKCLVTTIFQLTFFYSIPFCIYKTLNLNETGLFYMIGANALITMITAFVPMPGGVGAAEGSFYLFFAMFFNSHLIFPAILIWRIVTYYSCLICGISVSSFMIFEEKRKKIKDRLSKKETIL